MKSFDGRFDDRLPLSHGLVRTVRTLGEYRGRAELYLKQMPQVLETLRAASIIQSVESSSRIEGVTAARHGQVCWESRVPWPWSDGSMAQDIGIVHNIYVLI